MISGYLIALLSILAINVSQPSKNRLTYKGRVVYCIAWSCKDLEYFVENVGCL